MDAKRAWLGALVGAGCALASTTASGQEWLRWDEKPLATQRDPAKQAPVPPPAVSEPRTVGAPLVPLRMLSEARTPMGHASDEAPPAPVAAAIMKEPPSTAMARLHVPGLAPTFARAGAAPQATARMPSASALDGRESIPPEAFVVARVVSATQPALRLGSATTAAALRPRLVAPALSAPMMITKVEPAAGSALRTQRDPLVAPLPRMAVPALSTPMAIGSMAAPAAPRVRIEGREPVAMPTVRLRRPEFSGVSSPAAAALAMTTPAAASLVSTAPAALACADPRDCVTSDDLRETAVSSERAEPNGRQAIEAEIKRSLLRGH